MNAQKPEPLIDDAAAVAAAYRTLARLYLDPITDERELAQVREWLRSLQERAPSDEIRDAISRMQTFEPDNIDEVHRDFTHLFRGVHADQSVKPPYESLYTEGSLYGSTTTEIKRGLNATGVEFAEDAANEPPDHIGIELEFLANLCELKADDTDELTTARLRDAQMWLVGDHLLEWVPKLRAVLREAPESTSFYQGLAELTVEILQAHRKALDHEARA